MNAETLLKILQDISQTQDLSKLRVEIPISGKSIGKSPTSAVLGVFPGFDWEEGTLLIQPVEALKRVSEDK